MPAIRSAIHQSKALTALSALGLLALMPNAVWGEGAIRVIDCTITRLCDAAGSCQAAAGAVAFRMEPVQLDKDGAGRYQLRYGETQAQVNALSDIGPFVWTVGEERHTLLASSETNFLWHRLTLAPAPAATVRFLTCSIHQ